MNGLRGVDGCRANRLLILDAVGSGCRSFDEEASDDDELPDEDERLDLDMLDDIRLNDVVMNRLAEDLGVSCRIGGSADDRVKDAFRSKMLREAFLRNVDDERLS